MIPYWVIFAIPLLGVVMPGRLTTQARRIVWSSFSLLIVLIVGLRLQVGGDWEPYLEVYNDLRDREFLEAVLEGGIRAADPGYALLNWVSGQLDWDIYGVNLACGLIFVACFSKFARRQPVPWLAWVVAIPYLVIVVVMGYSRQGVALGLVFAGLAYLQERRVWPFVTLIVIAFLFHKSATLVLPFAFLLRGERNRWQIIALGLTLMVAAGALLYAQYESLWLNYVELQMISEGAAVRVWMNAVPAAVMLATARKWNRLWPDPGYWRYIAYLAIACTLLVDTASTAVDRAALYLAPIQVYVWCRFPLLFRDSAQRAGALAGICLVYAAVLWVWLNLAVHAPYWVPYRSALFE